MTETYEEALVRLTNQLTREFHDVVLSSSIQTALERDALAVLEIHGLPVIDDDSRGRARCPKCRRFLTHNHATRTRDGYASLNCFVHGWVGKWKL